MRLFNKIKKYACVFTPAEEDFNGLLQKEKMGEKLVNFVVYGKKRKAEILLKEIADKDDLEKSNLAYLLCTKVNSKVYHFLDSPIQKITPFQVALCAGDVAIHENDPQMCEMFKRYFEKIPDGLEEMQIQFYEIFPDGINSHIKQQKMQADAFKKEINTLINSIIASNKKYVKAINNKHVNSPLNEAIGAFREKVKILFIGQEKVFNPYYLLSTYEVFAECYNDFLSSLKRDLFAVLGIGFMQRNSAACLLQCLANDLGMIVEKQQPLFRSITIWGDLPGGNFKPVEMATSSGSVLQLGFSGFLHDKQFCFSWPKDYHPKVVVSRLQTLLSEKNNSLKKLMQDNPSPTTVRAMGSS